MSDASDLLLLVGAIVLALICVPLLDPVHKQVKLWFHDSQADDFTD